MTASEYWKERRAADSARKARKAAIQHAVRMADAGIRTLTPQDELAGALRAVLEDSSCSRAILQDIVTRTGDRAARARLDDIQYSPNGDAHAQARALLAKLSL